eukprot:GFUD01136691.1.p1 GENE.GFUD01136691.1~~GFUD01136691.1.p1  ORF type:complete len:105 (-),score=4.45 GFUD01136691.1:162-434(-)
MGLKKDTIWLPTVDELSVLFLFSCTLEFFKQSSALLSSWTSWSAGKHRLCMTRASINLQLERPHYGYHCLPKFRKTNALYARGGETGLDE